MDLSRAPTKSRTCASCAYWTQGWVGPESWGFCTWREARSRNHQPRMNVGSTYNLSGDGSVLETRSDAGCIQWTSPQPRQSKEAT